VDLGKRIEKIILNEKKYTTLDKFALEYHEEIAKPTLYQICRGERDMKLSTLLRLCRGLDLDMADLLKGL
jgi:DNA-binding Xre family transcriptional regulator